jgi:hypothetical protein
MEADIRLTNFLKSNFSIYPHPVLSSIPCFETETHPPHTSWPSRKLLSENNPVFELTRGRSFPKLYIVAAAGGFPVLVVGIPRGDGGVNPSRIYPV